MKSWEVLGQSALFKGINTSDINGMLDCLTAEEIHYKTGQYILWKGDEVHKVGILLSGKARSTKTGLDGKLVIVTLLEPGSCIGVLLAASTDRKSPVSVEMLEDGAAIFISIQNILKRSHCPHHYVLLENLLNGIAEKALILHDRNDCLIKPSIREKVLTFLKSQTLNSNSKEFTIPMNRNAMAEYLDVDRSALSRELSWMQRDGLIEFEKNWFLLN